MPEVSLSRQCHSKLHHLSKRQGVLEVPEYKGYFGHHICGGLQIFNFLKCSTYQCCLGWSVYMTQITAAELSTCNKCNYFFSIISYLLQG